jgi:hypothetical protein
VSIRYAKGGSNAGWLASGSDGLPNGINLRGSELGSWITLASRMATMGNHISTVVAVRIPPEIRQPVVGAVAILVARLVAVWAWANERLKHEPVDILISARRVVVPGNINDGATLNAARHLYPRL